MAAMTVMRLIPAFATWFVVSTALAQQPASPPPSAPADASTAAPVTEPAADDTASLLDEIKLSSLWTENTWTQWAILLGGIFAGLVLGKLAQTILRKIGDALDKRQAHVRAHVFTDLASPASLALFTIGLAVGLFQINMAEVLQTFAHKVVQTLIAVAVFWYLYNLISILEVALYRLTARTESTLDGMLVPMIRKSLRVFLAVIAVLFILQAIYDQNIGAWLAGLGIAGLAVSLAAQDSLKNLFGSITIFLDRPFLVGSYIKYAGELGTIEEIGFRSTKMRTLKGHVITIPNSAIVNDPVENIGVRPFIRRVLDVTVTYDTPPQKMREGIRIIREIFQADGIREAIHDPHDPDNPDKYPPRVYFNEFNAASLNIVVYYWFRPGVWWDYLEHADRFNQMLLERFNAAGIDFAFPTQTLYLAGDEKRPLTVGLTRPM